MKQWYIIRKEIVNLGKNIRTAFQEILKLLMVQTKNCAFNIKITLNLQSGICLSFLVKQMEGSQGKNDIDSSQYHTTEVKMNLNLLKNSKYFELN